MRPTFAEINLHAINENLRQVKKRVGKATKVMAVVKANAYGHGMIPVAKSVLKHNTAEYLGVAIVEEGIALRQARITAPTMVFTAPFVEQLNAYVQNNLEGSLCSIDIAKKLNHLAEKAGRITSGYRNVAYNKQIGGASDSAHRYGLALDIAVGDVREQIKWAREADKIFNRIGVYPNMGIIHVDLMPYGEDETSYKHGSKYWVRKRAQYIATSSLTQMERIALT